VNGEQIWLVVAAGGAVALVLMVACALLWRNSRRLTARLAELEDGLAKQLASTPHAAAAPVVTPVTAQPAAYVITAMDEVADEPTQAVPARIDGALFADIVARETVIKAAALAHGLRRGLSAETRNRIRFEMKREVKRSRKQRRADLKAALRDHQARDRARMAEDRAGEDAA
jgi:hypothetical protein